MVYPSLSYVPEDDSEKLIIQNFEFGLERLAVLSLDSLSSFLP